MTLLIKNLQYVTYLYTSISFLYIYIYIYILGLCDNSDNAIIAIIKLISCYRYWLHYLSIIANNYLNGSDHRVVASYSGLHEECEVNISTCLA